MGANGAGSGSSSSSRIYVAYIFRTESQSVAEEILKGDLLVNGSFVLTGLKVIGIFIGS